MLDWLLGAQRLWSPVKDETGTRQGSNKHGGAQTWFCGPWGAVADLRETGQPEGGPGWSVSSLPGQLTPRISSKRPGEGPANMALSEPPLALEVGTLGKCSSGQVYAQLGHLSPHPIFKSPWGSQPHRGGGALLGRGGSLWRSRAPSGGSELEPSPPPSC